MKCSMRNETRYAAYNTLLITVCQRCAEWQTGESCLLWRTPASVILKCIYRTAVRKALYRTACGTVDVKSVGRYLYCMIHGVEHHACVRNATHGLQNAT